MDRICSVLGVQRLAKKSTISDDDFRSPKIELLHGFTLGTLKRLIMLYLHFSVYKMKFVTNAWLT